MMVGPLGTEAPSIDEPGRRVTIPVSDGAARLGDAVRMLTDANIPAR